ncbi:SDR family NAD(P)-dependent oxidoreductase [Pseudanabaena sp. UWO311]|uniref:SDR family NAD(P)-dependent oxidoreductase n=1 Tax=Pseudanabaena sp. UWO311 TaxID=2487337 RepID=UPI00115B4522|nr:SDR family NAD(P)-dependent oxidoreductase [Pseudanabaena sp. UWO311]TYQ27791.1 SDR family NAD(P)-dependent oxidoreductase [Pseudanabaena sp. UWO311]
MTKKLEGKVALVTGASSGIGEATALALAAEGATVAIAARRLDRLEDLARRIRDNGGNTLAIALDVAEEKQVNKAIETIQSELGRIDILVNNAGVMLLSAVDGADTKEWRQMVDVNLLGLMYATHAVLPVMKTQGGGHIVNISSVAGRFSFTNCAVYNATKFGVNGFSDALRQEVSRDKIRVTIVEPGVVDTELTTHITTKEIKEREQKRLQTITALQSDDIADAIVYAVTQKPHVNVNEILVRTIDQ